MGFSSNRIAAGGAIRISAANESKAETGPMRRSKPIAQNAVSTFSQSEYQRQQGRRVVVECLMWIVHASDAVGGRAPLRSVD